MTKAMSHDHPVGSTMSAASTAAAKGPRRVCGAVVTYDPDEHLVDRLGVLAPQVDRLVVVDNGWEGEEFVRRAAAGVGAAVILDGRNLGIAAALNQAVRFARDAQCEWLLTMDQDTRASQVMVESLFSALAACPFRDQVAVAGSAHKDGQSSSPWTEVRSVITSGSLVRLDACLRVALFREELFVDYVDHEFCLRLRRYGYRIIKTTRATMAHEIGRPERRRFLWRHVTVTNHSAARRYYITRNRTRNRIVVWRTFAPTEPGFVARDMAAAAKELVKVLLETDRRRKLEAVLRGARDALAGRTGPIAATVGPFEQGERDRHVL